MAGEAFVIDPTSEDASNVQLTLTDNANGWYLLNHAYPPPPQTPLWSGSVDSEGDSLAHLKYGNRTVTLSVRQRNTSDANVQTQLGYLQQKVAKLQREGGTLKRTVPSGSTVVFDVITAELDIAFGQEFVSRTRADVTVTFTCKPFGRGAEQALSAHTETSKPCLVFTETSVPGDVPALGRLVVSENQAVDQYWAAWGLQSRFYDSAGSAALFYEAVSLTPKGSAAVTASPVVSGAYASGGNKAVRSGGLSASWSAILSSLDSGGSTHWSHVGSFRVFARVGHTASDDISLRLDWSNGDYRRVVSNDPVTVTKGMSGSWRLVDLGLVHPAKTVSGTQRWEARLMGYCATTGQTVDVNWLMLVPVLEGSGQVSADASAVDSDGVYLAVDQFNRAAGNLNAQSLDVGGTWSTSGSTTDLTTAGVGSSKVTRATTSDASARIALASGTAGMAAGGVNATLTNSALSAGAYQGVILRYVDASNYGFVRIQFLSGTAANQLEIYKVIGGSALPIALTLIANSSNPVLSVGITQAGAINAYVDGVLQLSASDSVFASGGTLASGKAGLYDYSPSPTACTRTYQNFWVSGIASDQACYASRQFEVRSNQVNRQDSAGALWQPPSVYSGDYLLVPASGRESRTTRMLVKMSRGALLDGIDGGTDDLAATLNVTPRYLQIPD